MWCRNQFQTLFWKMKVEDMSGSIDKSFRQYIFFVYQAEGYQNILKLSWIPLAFTSYEAFLKNKKRSGTSLPTLFFA